MRRAIAWHHFKTERVQMAKFTSAEVLKVSERLRRARDRSHPAHFLIGAGCSISAGIPSAVELIKKIHADYPAQCAELKNDDLHSYGTCMALLSINERRDLIRPYLEKAKINWGTIALAQLIIENYIGRILTVNFDLVLENACGLLGLQPAVYDFGVAPANDPAMIVSPAIVHLHGQSYGLVLLNTDEETQKHREKLQPILIDSLRSAPVVVMGYSGSADGIFQTLLEEFEGREPLYWVSYGEEPATHILPFMKKDHFQFIGGADFDRFMIELAQSLGCWPPHLFSDPLGHLLKGLSPVVPYPVINSDSAIDLLVDLRQKIETWQLNLNEEQGPSGALQKLFMKGDLEAAAKFFTSRFDPDEASDEDRDMASWSFIGWGNLLLEQIERAGPDEAAKLVDLVGEKYQAALAIRPETYEALYNWGTLLLNHAERVAGPAKNDLLIAAQEKFEAALKLKADDDETLSNLGNTLALRAENATGAESLNFFALAAEKFLEALAIKPDDYETLVSLGALYSKHSKFLTGDEAEQTTIKADEMYRTALKIKPGYHGALYNSGTFLLHRAHQTSGEKKADLLAAAEEKLRAALVSLPEHYGTMGNLAHSLLEQAKLSCGDAAKSLFARAKEVLLAAARQDPTQTYDLACVAALQGNENECRQNLENAEKYGTLPNIEHLVADTDLNGTRGTPWFKELLARQKQT